MPSRELLGWWQRNTSRSLNGSFLVVVHFVYPVLATGFAGDNSVSDFLAGVIAFPAGGYCR
jgi:nitrate reductase NapE component